MPNSFASIGFLSPEVENLRRSIFQKYAEELNHIREGFRIAQKDLPREEEQNRSQRAYLLGLGMWVRAIEGCQASVLLTEYGFHKSQYATLRTAFECLFVACGLWRGTVTPSQVEQWHDFERLKQARQLCKVGENEGWSDCPDDVRLQLEAINEEQGSKHGGASYKNIAEEAGLTLFYESSYRGLSMLGAHATLTSLTLSPCQTKTDIHLILRQTRHCLVTGINRHKEAIEKYLLR